MNRREGERLGSLGGLGFQLRLEIKRTGLWKLIPCAHGVTVCGIIAKSPSCVVLDMKFLGRLVPIH